MSEPFSMHNIVLDKNMEQSNANSN